MSEKDAFKAKCTFRLKANMSLKATNILFYFIFNLIKFECVLEPYHFDQTLIIFVILLGANSNFSDFLDFFKFDKLGKNLLN